MTTLSLLTRPDRLAALRRTALLDTPPEEAFDRLTRMAARLLGTPVALISLVAEDHQYFKSAIGLPEPWASRRVNPISFSFCGQVVATGEPLVLEDARRHPLQRHNPVIRELGWVAYAGVPLVTRQGHTIGALAVIDKTPRLWSERDIALLQDLAASVATEIELRTEIAERRQAEYGRRESQEQFHSSFEDSGIGMALVSPEGRWLRVNRALCEILGVSRENLVGFSVDASTHPDDVSADSEALRLLLAGECRTYTMEKRYVRPSGKIVWTLVNVSLVAGPEGQPGHLITAIQDITERKQSDSALRESEERYRLLSQASKEAIRDWDLVTDRLIWEEGNGPLLDYQRSELGDTVSWWYDRINPADRERVMASLDTALAEGRDAWTEEYRFRRADGSYAVVQDRAHIARDETGAPVRVISAMSGLSNAHRADRQLQQVLDALQVGVSVVDKQGRIVIANSSDRQIWGAGPDRDIPDVAEHRGWWADTGEQVRPEEWGALRAIGGEFSADEEVRIETADGEQKTILSSATPLLDESGEIVGAVNVSQDVTATKAAEVTRAHLEDQVQRAQKMEAVGRLAGGIAHDFNNLLTGILSYSDLILQELRPADPLRADIEQIRDAGQRAANLTRQLLAFSRRQVLLPRVLSLNALVTEMEPMLSRLAGPTVTIETELYPALGSVLVDQARVEQVLVNLVVNAREAMPEGGRIGISSANWKDEAGVGQGGVGPRRQEYVSLWISDTGVGMDAATQSRIFEPFFTTKQPGSGIGLGLSTAYGIVEQSGGNITVESAPGQGTTIGLHFPRVEAVAETPTIERPPSAMGGKETLLLVEDEAPVRDSVRRLLEWHGYTVIEARNGADALQIYDGDEQEIDLVLTDLVMPGMGGHELVERLRARHPDLRVLFMSGYADKPMPNNGTAGSGTAYLEKPFTVELLMQRLREVLEG